MSLPFELPPSPLIRDAALRLDADRPSHILDIGCHVGRNSIYLAKLGHEVLGVTDKLEDASHATQIAAIKGVSETCRFIVGDARNLPISGLFDIVLINEVLHLMTKNQAQQTVANAKSVTKQGGLHIVSGYVVDPELANAKNLATCFRPGELAGLYQEEPGWEILGYIEEEHSEQTVGNRQIINSLAKVVAQRSW